MADVSAHTREEEKQHMPVCRDKSVAVDVRAGAWTGYILVDRSGELPPANAAYSRNAADISARL